MAFEIPKDACEDLIQSLEIVAEQAELADPELAAKMKVAGNIMCELCQNNCTQAMCKGDRESAVRHPLLARLVEQVGYSQLASESDDGGESDPRKHPLYWELPEPTDPQDS